MNDMFDLLEGLAHDEDEVRDADLIKAPFPYPGGKQKSAHIIIKHLPVRNSYIEPFGGGANVLLARQPSKIEVYNDRFGGVVDFYRCLRDQDLLNRLAERLELTVHAREEFIWCRDNWYNEPDIVERAARWYYMTIYSFGAQGRNFGRAIASGNLAGKIHTALPDFTIIHERLRYVQIENQDYHQLMKDFDSPDAVFYCDPPYLDAFGSIYKHEMTLNEHRRFMELVHDLHGFVAVSSYPNNIYDAYNWDDVITWEQSETTTAQAFKETNYKANITTERSKVKEALYVKEAK